MHQLCRSPSESSTPPASRWAVSAPLRAILLAAALSILLSACDGYMASGEHEARAELAGVKGWISSMAKQSGETVRPVGTVIVGRLRHGEEVTFPLEITGIHDAAVIAACDSYCADLDLRVITTDGRLVSIDEDENAYPIIDLRRGESQALRLKVSMAGCSRSSCTFAIQQLEYADPEELVGTCFAVSPDGLLMTSNHLVGKVSEIAVTFGNGREAEAEVVRRSEGNDLALLRIRSQTEHWLPFAEPEKIAVGMQAFTVGFPSPDTLGSTIKFTEGSVASLTGWIQETTLLQISIPIQPSSSGSPVVAFDGTVLGVVDSSAHAEDVGAEPQLVNYARHAAIARLLLPTLQLLPHVTPAQTREEAIDRAAKAVCQVRAK